MKTCRKCGETKPLSDFARHAQRRDGHHSYCKACQKKGQHKDWRVQEKKEMGNTAAIQHYLTSYRVGEYG